MKTNAALALIEVNSIPVGILTADAMLKEAPLAVVKTGTVHNGKYLILIAGSVASVEAGFKKGMSKSGDDLLDAVFLPDIHPDVYEASLGERKECGDEAIAIVEMATVAAVLRGSDAAMKGANVQLVEIRMADDLGGKAIVIYAGKVEEVEVASLLSEKALGEKELMLSQTIIPRVDPELASQLNQSTLFSRANLVELREGE